MRPGDTGALHVLVVEDNDGIRRMLERLLRAEGMSVVSASNGAAALEIAPLDGAIHLLITDIRLPEIGGIALASALAARIPGLRVLFISGQHDDEVVRICRTETHRAFMLKPFDPDRLLEEVRALLARA